ncbi:NAD-dependent protein deacylase [Pseudoneobacillus sp. C159]
MENSIQTLKKWLAESQYTVIFTGAGMSTESGIPDFRSATTGIWKHKDPMKLASTNAMKNHREDFIEFYRHRIDNLGNLEPNTGHHILAKWEQEGKIKAIITQNVDGFHQKAGSENVSELHGTLRSCHCDECGEVYSISRFMEEDLTCACGGFIRPGVVLFGESLPANSFHEAGVETNRADLFIVLGSSLSVAPANYFPVDAKRNGAKLVIINMEPTDLDSLADIVINDRKIGGVLQELGGERDEF